MAKARITNALLHEHRLRGEAAAAGLWVQAVRALANTADVPAVRSAQLRLALHRRVRLISDTRHARRCLLVARTRGYTRRAALSRLALKHELSRGRMPGWGGRSTGLP